MRKELEISYPEDMDVGLMIHLAKQIMTHPSTDPQFNIQTQDDGDWVAVRLQPSVSTQTLTFYRGDQEKGIDSP